VAGETYDSVPVRVERDDEQGVYKLGVVIDNAFVTFAAVKTGHVDELVEREQVKAEAKTQADREQSQQLERQRQQEEYDRQRREAEQSHSPTPPEQ
jgi:hypothetical protein